MDLVTFFFFSHISQTFSFVVLAEHARSILICMYCGQDQLRDEADTQITVLQKLQYKYLLYCVYDILYTRLIIVGSTGEKKNPKLLKDSGESQFQLGVGVGETWYTEGMAAVFRLGSEGEQGGPSEQNSVGKDNREIKFDGMVGSPFSLHYWQMIAGGWKADCNQNHHLCISTY